MLHHTHTLLLTAQSEAILEFFREMDLEMEIGLEDIGSEAELLRSWNNLEQQALQVQVAASFRVILLHQFHVPS